MSKYVQPGDCQKRHSEALITPYDCRVNKVYF
jgi:hypothetical protein